MIWLFLVLACYNLLDLLLVAIKILIPKLDTYLAQAIQEAIKERAAQEEAQRKKHQQPAQVNTLYPQPEIETNLSQIEQFDVGEEFQPMQTFLWTRLPLGAIVDVCMG